MNKEINGKSLTIIILVSVLIILISTVIMVMVKDNRNKNTNSPSNKAPEQKIEKSPEDKAKDMVYNNYVISYIIEGDVITGEGTFKVEGSDDVYYAVTDVLLKEIHSIEDIDKLIENNLSEIATARAKKMLESPYTNEYTHNNGTLYIKKPEKSCEKLPDLLIDRDKVELKENGDKIYGVYNNIPFQGYYDNEKNLKANTLWFSCADNFGTIGTGKDDVYVPKYIKEENE